MAVTALVELKGRQGLLGPWTCWCTRTASKSHCNCVCVEYKNNYGLEYCGL